MKLFATFVTWDFLYYMEKQKTKDRLLLEAYKLFASKPYDQVTFNNLEEATKLSRGAILYHIKNKENLFREVIEQYIFERNSLQSIVKNNPKIGLWNFILLFLESCKKLKEEMKDLGIRNINLAMFNVECAAFFFYPSLRQTAKEWVDNEVEVWKQVLHNALENKEIKEDTDIPLMSVLFEDISLGNSYHGVTLTKGQDLEMFKKELSILYDMIKS